jgi:hypothetical protein
MSPSTLSDVWWFLANDAQHWPKKGQVAENDASWHPAKVAPMLAHHGPALLHLCHVVWTFVISHVVVPAASTATIATTAATTVLGQLEMA